MKDVIYSANAIPITPSNKLRFAFWNGDDQAQYEVYIRYQIENKDGTISDNAEVHSVLAAAIGSEKIITLPYGNLLAVTISTYQTVLQNGTLYAVASLQYGDVNDNKAQLSLLSGYVLASAPLNYPRNEPRAINSGLPSSFTLALSDPGANLEIQTALPATARGQLWHGSFTLVADANAANRRVNLKLFDNNGEFWTAAADTIQVAGETKTYFLSPIPQPIQNPTDVIYIEIPPMAPIQGLQIQTVTTNLQAADEYQGIRFWLQRWTAM